MRRKPLTADTPEARPDPEVDVRPGQFVAVHDDCVAEWFGKGLALVLKRDESNGNVTLAIVGAHWPFENRLRATDTDVAAEDRLPYRAFWIKQSLVRPRSVATDDAMHLGELPVTALSIVLAHMTLHDAALAALVNKRFASAFRDERAWRLRLRRDDIVVPADLPATAHAMERYRAGAPWRIHVVSIVEHSGGSAITQHFCVLASPSTPLDEFLQRVRKDERNRRALHIPQTGFQDGPGDSYMVDLCLFEPQRLYRTTPGSYGRLPRYPNAVPTGSFKHAQTVGESGLCDGAVLDQEEHMLED